MMKFFGLILSSLLAAALSLTVVLWTLGATLDNASYLEDQAAKVQLYDKLAGQLPGTNAADLSTQVKSVLPQFTEYFTGTGPVPTGDFGNGPAALVTPNAQLLSFTRSLRPAGLLLPVAALVLTLMILALMRGRRLVVLARAVFGAVLSLAITAAILWFGSTMAIQNLAIPDGLRSALIPLVVAVTHDIATRLAVAAAVALGLWIALLIARALTSLKNRFIRPPKNSSKDPLPAPPGVGPR